MKRVQHLLSAGAFAIALGAGGVSISEAGGAQDASGSSTPSITPFPLPSDRVGTLSNYPNRTDPTGQLIPNTQPPVPGSTDDSFLTYIINNSANPANHVRVDQPPAACQYYKVIHAVSDCSPSGDMINPITFDQWKQAVGIDQYGPAGKTDVAHFVNQVDLNLTRDHHMISYGRDQLAGYVCNHTGPAATAEDPTSLFPTQYEINRALADIRRNKHLVACVAMEFSSRDTPAGTPPFTKFWIFGKEGELLSTIDLDGRGPKGVPNVCTACHGGKFDYEGADGQFDHTKVTGRPPGDLGAHFLPFDIANFAFSSRLSDAQREEAIFKMNMNVFNTEANRWTVGSSGFVVDGFGSLSIQNLIQGWYGDVTANNTSPHLNRQFVPFNGWDDFNGPYTFAYQRAVAHSCRTCHVAMDNAPTDLDPGIVTGLAQSFVCSQHVMPNAKVTFDRFWLSSQVGVPGQPPGTIDQPSALRGLLNVVNSNSLPCNGP